MAIPIIGQPTLGDWNLTVVIECACKRSVLWTGKPAWEGGPSALVVCRCGKMYSVSKMPERDPISGDLNIRLGMKETK